MPADRNVLLLSSDVPLRAELGRQLREAGFVVGEAKAERRALQRARAWQAYRTDLEAIHAVVLDVAPPLEEPLAVLDAIRRQDAWLPVLLLTRSLDGPRLPSPPGTSIVLGRLAGGEIDGPAVLRAAAALVRERERGLGAP